MRLNRLFQSTEHKIYHVYGKFRIESPLATKKNIWNQFSTNLNLCIDKHSIEVFCFTLMSNHFHMVIKIQNNIEEYFRSEFYFAHNNINSYIIPSNYWSYLPVTNVKALHYTIQYIYMNPVEAGLYKEAYKYPYSTLYQLFPTTLDTDLNEINLHDPFHLITNPNTMKELFVPSLNKFKYLSL